MNNKSIFILKVLRKLYAKVFRVKTIIKVSCEENPDIAAQIIYEKLMNEEPCMIARFGANELSIVVNYSGVKEQDKSIWKYIKGEENQWWWNKPILKQMYNNAGFYPPTKEKIEQFCELTLEDMKEVDILGSWVANERYFDDKMQCEKVHLRLLEPFWSEIPWTKALQNKKILVIHPFSETILAQYKKRELLFDNKNILPEFESLTVIKAVQTLGKASSEYADWFEALESMKRQIDETDFDVCLIGAGAYGFPLAAHVKRIGKIGFHMGGSLQLLFGIRGKRWEDPEYGVPQWGIVRGAYSSMMNEYWVRPGESEKPKTANSVEGACYW
jgi:hypothetical protein